MKEQLEVSKRAGYMIVGLPNDRLLACKVEAVAKLRATLPAPVRRK